MRGEEELTRETKLLGVNKVIKYATSDDALTTEKPRLDVAKKSK